MADIDLKTSTPDTSLPTTGFLFGADSQAASAPSVFTTQAVATTLLGSTTLSGASITADAPVLNMSQTWNNGATTFTGIKYNVTDTASAAASLLMDLQVGGSSQFNVNKAGRTYAPNFYIHPTWNTGLGGNFVEPRILAQSNVIAAFSVSHLKLIPGIAFGFSVGDPATTNLDTILTRRGAANLRLGAADAAAPVAQTLSVQSVVAGTSNTAGANLTITGSQGTGTGAGGSIIFQVAPAGSSGTAQNALSTALTIDSTSRLSLGDGSISAPVFRVGTGTSVQLYSRASGWLTFTDGSVNLFEFQNASGSRGVFSMNSTGALQWCSGGAGNTAGDTILYRDAANTLALRNGANAQAFNVYNTFTDASNYERGALAWVSNVLVLSTENAGTGGNRQLSVSGRGNLNISSVLGSIFFQTSSLNRWGIDPSGMFTAIVDNTLDIGASASNRPRNIYVATSITPGRGVTVAGLPTPSTGMIARVTDALAPTIGATVTGGGAAYALVNYNGANWTVIGI